MVKKAAAQVAPAQRAAALKARNQRAPTRPSNLPPRTPLPDSEAAPDAPERLNAANQSQGPPLRFLNKAEVEERTALSFPTIWKLMRQGRFPQARCVDDTMFSKPLWLEHEIDEWMLARPTKSYRAFEA